MRGAIRTSSRDRRKTRGKQSFASPVGTADNVAELQSGVWRLGRRVPQTTSPSTPASFGTTLCNMSTACSVSSPSQAPQARRLYAWEGRAVFWHTRSYVQKSLSLRGGPEALSRPVTNRSIKGCAASRGLRWPNLCQQLDLELNLHRPAHMYVLGRLQRQYTHCTALQALTRARTPRWQGTLRSTCVACRGNPVSRKHPAPG